MTESLQPPIDALARAAGDAWVLYLICLALLMTAGIFAQTFWPLAGLVFTLLVIFLLPAVIYVRSKGLGIRAGLRLNSVAPSMLLLAVLTGAGAWSVAILLHQWISSVIGPAPPVGLGVSGRSGYLLLFLTLALLPGICEECLFRGVIQGILERRGRWFAVIVTAFLFGIVHLDPWRILPAAFLGCVFGWLTIRTQSIVPAILAHVANNTTAITAGYMLRDAERIPVGLILVLAVLLVVAVVLVQRQTRLPDDPADKNPLAVVPCRLPLVISRAAAFLTVVATAMVIGIAVLITVTVTFVKMNDDTLLPHIKSGDTLALMKKDFFAFDLNIGDTVSFRRGEEVVTRVFIRQDGDKIFVKGTNRELQVDMRDVIGKMIQILPGQ